MTTIKTLRGATAVLAAVGTLGLLMDHGSPVHAAGGGPTVTIGGPIPLPVSLTGTPVPVTVQNFPSVQDVHVTNASLPVTLQRTVVSGGQYFEITQPDAAPFEPAVSLIVPAGVVLTDAHVTFSVPESVPNAAAIYVSDRPGTYVYQIVNNTTFGAGVDLHSGILSTGDMRVELSCYNIAGNHCQGALMWSGYTTP
jgi:hypothetical protein